MDFRERAQEVILIEARAVAKQVEHLHADFNQACSLLLQCQGRIILIGMGKSGHIASKIAATLASTGSPAFAVHPAEAMHGDLGMIKENDIVIALSYSGKTFELLNLIPHIQKMGIPLIALTGDLTSPLAKRADIALCVAVDEEACPLGLAPTASTTACLAMGDAIAIALLEERGFTPEQFALSHPGGSLGKRLLLKVKDFMHDGANLPRVSPDAPLSDALIEMSAKRLGITAITTPDGCLLGIFTDGDIRRALQKGTDFSTTPIDSVMSKHPKFIHPEALASEAFDLMETNKITALVVLNEAHHLVGIVHLHDLLQGGL